jgi:hypothetical protein
MIIYIEDLFREINILNWYKGEAAKNGIPDATAAETNADTQDALMYHLRDAVTDMLSLANLNWMKFTCEYKDDSLIFSLSPLREGREYLLELLKNCIRQYLVYEIRRLWMMNVRPDWADATKRESLRQNITDSMTACTKPTERVRRRYAPLGI